MRAIARRMLPAAACALLAGAAAPSPRPAAGSCPTAPAADTTGWRRVETGIFTMLLPRGYRKIRTQGIDSAVDAWNAPRGRRVHTDYGSTMYVGGGPFRDPDLVCERGPGDRWTIVAYEQYGRHGIGYYGYDPSSEDRALVVMAESPRREDIPELLAIIHSLRWDDRPQR